MEGAFIRSQSGSASIVVKSNMKLRANTFVSEKYRTLPICQGLLAPGIDYGRAAVRCEFKIHAASIRIAELLTLMYLQAARKGHSIVLWTWLNIIL